MEKGGGAEGGGRGVDMRNTEEEEEGNKEEEQKEKESEGKERENEGMLMRGC